MSHHSLRFRSFMPVGVVARFCLLVLGSGLVWLLFDCTGLVEAQEKAAEIKTFKHQITGLFCPEREQDLRALCQQKLARLKLVSIDYASAEATFAYDPAVVFPGAKPEQYVERLDNELRNASQHTFGAKPLRTIAKEKLQLVEIPIAGLDCKACSLAVYEMMARLPGVEQANASFRSGRATALIDPEKIDQARIEMALKERGVSIATSAERVPKPSP